MLAWIAVALLSISWLVGLGYYHLTNWPAWIAAVVAGTLCMMGFKARMPSSRESALACVLVVPACIFAPWPYRAALVLVALGLFLGGNLQILAALQTAAKGEDEALQRRVRRFLACYGRLASGLLASGCVLLAQALGLELYMVFTSRSHELPGPLAQLLGAAAKALGIDSAVSGSTLAAFSMRKIHDLGATWELLVDPASWCFLFGGLVLVAWHFWGTRPQGPTPPPWRGEAVRAGVLLGAFVLPVLAWLPLRAALLVALYLHEVLRVDYDAPLQVMKRFWSTPTHLLLLAGPVLLAWRLVPLGKAAGADASDRQKARPRGLALGKRSWAGLLAALGVAAITAGILWDPVGTRKGGRIVFEEYHPEGDRQWERTDKPFDTTWYGHLSGYNYWCIWDYMTRFYDVARRTQPLNDAALQDCDVLIVKIPTRPFSNTEIQAIEQFVAQGGGLMLVGEHTNVFGSGTYLNSIARRFGFTFRHDCLFGVDMVWEQHYEPPRVPHPVVQYIQAVKSNPWMEFATSCSIDPGTSSGRAVIRSVGLKNLGADYHVSNYYPKPDDTPEMRYGAWVQLWAMRYGRGRVLAFTDSTIFSNFSVCEPGKKELWMGMVEWLNHHSPAIEPRGPLVLVGSLLVILAMVASIGWSSAWPILLGAGILGWTVAALGAKLAHGNTMPYPAQIRPLAQVNTDQTLCDARLPRNGFISMDTTDYGIFERWILRLGYFTARRKYPEILEDKPQLILFLEPSKKISAEYRDALVRYVESGGRVLVVDSPPEPPRRRPRPVLPKGLGIDYELPGEGAPAGPESEPVGPREPTTNALLEPFGMSVDHATVVGGANVMMTSTEGWPSVPAQKAVVVNGGRPFASVDGKPVGASISVGNKGGSVTVIGFGRRFREEHMGATGDVEPDKSPDKHLSNVYSWQYALLRGIIEGVPLGLEGPPSPPPAKPLAQKAP